MKRLRRYLDRHMERAAASFQRHVDDALDLFTDEPYEAPEFADPVLTVDDRQLLHGWGITP